MTTSASNIAPKNGLEAIPSKNSIFSHVRKRIAGLQRQEQQQEEREQNKQKQQHDSLPLSQEDIERGITHLFQIPRGCELGFVINNENTITKVHPHSQLYGLLIGNEDRLISIDGISIQNLSLQQIKEVVAACAKEIAPKLIIGIKRETSQGSYEATTATQSTSEMPVRVTSETEDPEESTTNELRETSSKVNKNTKAIKITQGESSDTETEDESEDVILNSRGQKRKKALINMVIKDSVTTKKAENSNTSNESDLNMKAKGSQESTNGYHQYEGPTVNQSTINIDEDSPDAQEVKTTTKDNREYAMGTSESTQEHHVEKPSKARASRKSSLVWQGKPTDVLEGGWPPGWTKRVYRRTKTGRRDSYWYTPDESRYFSTLKAVKAFLKEMAKNTANAESKQMQEAVVKKSAGAALLKDKSHGTIDTPNTTVGKARTISLYKSYWVSFRIFVDNFSGGNVRKTADGRYLTRENVAEFFKFKQGEGMTPSKARQCKYAFRWYAKNVENNVGFVVETPFEEQVNKAISSEGNDNRTEGTPKVIISQDSSNMGSHQLIQNVSVRNIQPKKSPETKQKKPPVETPKKAIEPQNAILIWEGAPPEDVPGGWPSGWRKKVYRRTKNNTRDSYWFTPGDTRKFNSLKRAKEFLKQNQRTYSVEPVSTSSSNEFTNQIVTATTVTEKSSDKKVTKPMPKSRRRSTSNNYQYQRPNYKYELQWATFCSFVDGNSDSKVKKTDEGHYLTRVNVDKFFEMKKEEKVTPSHAKQCRSALQWYANNVEFLRSPNETFNVNSPIIEDIVESLAPLHGNKRSVQKFAPGESFSSDIVLDSPQTDKKTTKALYRMNRATVSPKDLHGATRSFTNLTRGTKGKDGYSFEVEADIIARIDNHLVEEEEEEEEETNNNVMDRQSHGKKKKRKGPPEEDTEPPRKRSRQTLEVSKSKSGNQSSQTAYDRLSQEKEKMHEQTFSQELRVEIEQLRQQNEKLCREKERILEEKLIEELRSENAKLRNEKLIEDLRLENERLRSNNGI